MLGKQYLNVFEFQSDLKLKIIYFCKSRPSHSYDKMSGSGEANEHHLQYQVNFHKTINASVEND